MTDIITKKEVTVTAGSQIPTGEKAEGSQTANYIIYFLLGIIEIILAFRFILKLTGANPATGFVDFTYTLSQLFVMPFTAIFPQATGSGAVTTAVFEPSILVAMAVYAVIAWGLAQIISILSGKVQQ